LRYWQALAFFGDPMHAQHREQVTEPSFAHVAK
jgi:hypothetical protein